MKKLYIIRHAEAGKKRIGTTDKERALTSLGEKNASLMAKELSKTNLEVDYIICSPAKRTIDTAGIFQENLNIPPENLISNPLLYNATFFDVIDVLDELRNDIKNIIICGHNPTVTDFINYISNTSISSLPTCGIASLELQTNNWENINEETAKIEFLDYPCNHE